MNRAPVLALAAAALSVPAVARAHKPSDSYLSLRPADGGALFSGRWDVAVRDLDHALALDGNRDGAVTWGEVRRRERELAGYVLGRLALSSGGEPCRVEGGRAGIVSHSDGAYLALPLSVRCPRPGGALSAGYQLFAGVDPQHRGILRMDDGSDRTVILPPGAPPRRIAVQGAPPAPSLLAFVGQGILHIWQGLDHVLFLIALLLPSVVRRRQGHWIPVDRIRFTFVDVTKIVTAFTAAHSVTLSLASAGLVSVPSRVVEPAIAASVVLAAFNNVRPVFGPDRWVVAFALGLLHGFGFSSVLADLGIAPGHLARSLVGFNLGVEVGQLVIVALFVPLAFLVRHTGAYRRLGLVGGSLAIAGLSLVWVVERITTNG